MAKHLFSKAELDWSTRAMVNVQVIGVSLQRTMAERAMHSEMLATSKSFRVKGSQDNMLDVLKAYAQHHNLPVPDNYAIFKDFTNLIQHMMAKLVQDIPKQPQQESLENSTMTSSSAGETKWKQNEDGTYSHELPYDMFVSRKKYIMRPDGSWMQLQSPNAAQMTRVAEVPPALAPSAAAPVLTMEIPGLDNISKRLEATLAGQQLADKAITMLQEQVAEIKKQRTAQ